MFEKFFASFQESVIQTTCIVTIAVCLFLIVIDILLFVLKIQKNKSFNGTFCIILSTLLGCIFVVPISASVDKLIAVSEKKASDKQLLLELESGELNIENQKLKIELSQLNKELGNLRCSQISAMQFEKIAELALLKTNLYQTKVYDEIIGDVKQGMGVRANFYYDQLLLVCNHDIEAKFGVDLSLIRVKKSENGGIIVSGIKPVFIGASRNITETPVSEIRTVNMDNDNHVKSINVKYDVNSLQEVKQLLESKNREYQTSLKDMENFEFLEEAVVTLARNFICIIFAPVYGENIIFDNSDFYNGADSDGYSIEEFIQSEIEFKNNEILEKLDKMR